MSIMLIAGLMFLSLLLLLLTGRQIFLIVGAVGTIFCLVFWGPEAEAMPFISGYACVVRWYPLLALPPFIFMGLVLAESGVADKLFQAIYVWMGRLKGGLAMGTIGVCSLIAAMVGEATAGTVTAATIALPAMLKRKYDKLMVTGVVEAGGALGFLIPPSLVLILYGMIARVSIGHLWLAGVFPGILLATMYIIYIAVRCHFRPELGPPLPPEERVNVRAKFRALGSGIAPVILIFTVLGLLFMGVTSLIECSAIGAIGALVCAAINRRLNWDMMKPVLNKTMNVSSMFLWIIAAALLFGAVFDALGAIHAIEGLFGMIGANRWVILIAMQASFILMGMFLDDTAMLLIVAPMYIPIVANLGFSLVWYGVLYTITCEMAYLTPPFGYTLFIMRGIVPKESGITMGDIYRSVIPFVGIQAGCLALIMAFPQIALWLPTRVFGGA